MSVAVPEDVEDEDSKLTLWQCDHCNLFNNPKRNNCQSCFQQKPKDAKTKVVDKSDTFFQNSDSEDNNNVSSSTCARNTKDKNNECNKNKSSKEDEFPYKAVESIDSFNKWINEIIKIKNLEKNKIDQFTKNLRDHRNVNLLHSACINGCSELIPILISKYHININEPDNDGYTPLYYAVNQWDDDCVCELIKFRPRLDHSTLDCVVHVIGFPIYICGGQTVFHIASEKNSIDCLKLLLDYMLKCHKNEMINILNIKDNNGYNAMDIARMEGNNDVLKMLSQFIRDNSKHNNDNNNKIELDDTMPTENERKEMKRKYFLQIRERISKNQENKKMQDENNIAKYYQPMFAKLFFIKEENNDNDSDNNTNNDGKKDDNTTDENKNDENKTDNNNDNIINKKQENSCDTNGIFPKKFLHSKFLQFLEKIENNKDDNNKLKTICDEYISNGYLVNPQKGIFIFQIFSDEFCNKLILESENYIKQALSSSNHGLLPIQRPNSMNSYGLILNTIGMKPFWTYFMNEILQPISNVLLPPNTWRYYCDSKDNEKSKNINKNGVTKTDNNNNNNNNINNEKMNENKWDFKSHHTFMIRYKEGEDIALETHIDASDVTLNVCLGKEGFNGAKVYFHNISGSIDDKEMNQSYQSPHPEKNCKYCTYKLFHKIGYGVLHIGKYVHGAQTLTNGERCNVVLWAREYQS